MQFVKSSELKQEIKLEDDKMTKGKIGVQMMMLKGQSRRAWCI